MTIDLGLVRSALFLPASNPRAIAKGRELAADLVILDLEDAVKREDKESARKMAAEALGEPWDKPVAVRLNVASSEWYEQDIEALVGAAPDLLVLPKVEEPMLVERVASRSGTPVAAMIETPAGVLGAAAIARAHGLVGLIAGTNDLAVKLGLPSTAPRSSLSHALQTIVLAARAADIAAFDGVFNSLDDADGFAQECQEGRMLGFDGKSLIHPSQVEPCNRIFSPTEAELDRARRLVEEFDGGAQRFEDRMIESMHVEQARRLLKRSGCV